MKQPLTPAQKSALEFATTQAYEALKRAVETGEILDAATARNHYKTGFETGLENVISLVHPGQGIALSKRNTEKAKPVDKYLVQQNIGDGASKILLEDLEIAKSHPELLSKNSRTRVTEEKLKAAVDEGKSYNTLGEKAILLACAGKYQAILNVMDYVRSK